MSLRNEVRVIPALTWLLAVLAYIGIAIGLIAIAIPQSRDTSNLPEPGKVALGLFAAAIPAIYILCLATFLQTPGVAVCATWFGLCWRSSFPMRSGSSFISSCAIRCPFFARAVALP
jgi:hypothetical protein